MEDFFGGGSLFDRHPFGDPFLQRGMPRQVGPFPFTNPPIPSLVNCMLVKKERSSAPAVGSLQGNTPSRALQSGPVMRCTQRLETCRMLAGSAGPPGSAGSPCRTQALSLCSNLPAIPFLEDALGVHVKKRKIQLRDAGKGAHCLCKALQWPCTH